MELPDVWAMQAIQWQFFVTLTFSSYRECERADGSTYTVPLNVPGRIVQERMVAGWLRDVAAHRKVHFLRMMYAMRSERGELLGREHLHLLIAGLPSTCLNRTNCEEIAFVWSSRGGGHAQVRVYDGSRDGLAYMCKGLGDKKNLGGANVYEMRKFVSANPDRELRVSKSVWRCALANARRAKSPKSHNQGEQGRVLASSVPVGKTFTAGANKDCMESYGQRAGNAPHVGSIQAA